MKTTTQRTDQRLGNGYTKVAYVVPDELVEKLRQQASDNSRSMISEVIVILKHALDEATSS
jgi:hypothetical protein